MVLDVIVRAARQELGNLRPLVAVNSMILKDQRILLLSPPVLLNIGVQVVVPANIQCH